MSPAWIAVGLAVGAQARDDVPRFRTEVRRVFVDVFVTRDDEAVLGLAAEDFELLDDGVAQEIELVRTDAVPLSTLAVLDTSGSLDEAERHLLSEAARVFLAGLGPRDEVGLLTATHRLALRVPLTREHGALPLALSAPMPSGATSIRDAVFAGLTLVEGGSGRPLLIVLTDGADNTSWLGEEALFEAARSSECVVYVLAPELPGGDGQNRAGLSFRGAQPPPRPVDGRPYFRRLAEATGGALLDVRRPEELASAFRTLLDQMKARYLLVFEPHGVPDTGWHELRVRLRRQRGVVRARAGYRANP